MDINIKTAVAIPTYNALSGGLWEEVLQGVESQTHQPAAKFIIDSSSTDATVEIAQKYGFSSDIINKKDFNHGLTRQFCVDKFVDFDIIFFLTQDAVLKDKDSFSKLIACFDDPLVAAAYGRQLTSHKSSLSEKAARSFNYPGISRVKTMDDIGELGLHTAFCSDSFSAYRIADLKKIGGFPKTDFAEDMLVCARLLMAGRHISYAADAVCCHAHPYNIVGEFKRGLEIGRMHQSNQWLLDNFGKAEKRGAKLLSSVVLYLRPLVLLQFMPKYAGYLVAKIFRFKK